MSLTRGNLLDAETNYGIQAGHVDPVYVQCERDYHGSLICHTHRWVPIVAAGGMIRG